MDEYDGGHIGRSDRGTIRYGDFINALIAFVIIAAVIYFFVVKPYTSLMERFKPAPTPAPVRDCPYCTSSIPVAATRCPFCTSQL